ncbi:2-oxoacid:acceptor oxidoreductase subunit alpha [Clostridiaceae bacterium UIB06]|uniref:2-oxoacid:acceptor oxidoreductase subunit alpha n=1 Tax=Clostridium thailandense TaxID=2794346 RepID=A0A949WUU6_9CLOT|nr:2-oxoacid:acceptor oxidoreductase subunit alpha [Clostridium thailandense]MBV7272962.1 2-oxoacid:acceptor oxidoreductase subunit alpha [Clostridium thailandense]MCH5136227.1 2-oxoacid:acceptor oxidoreductase subunit alpha [Clostridiaceae bacterium UIB06]
MSLNNVTKFVQGNEAIVEGAIAAGARFYAGYPITPSTEIAECASIRLPQEEGIYIQMEDELGSIAAVIGASLSGKKSFTATSGPGLSLMAENLGVAIMGEVPCVLVDVQRSGPSTGLATKPAQGDVMQSRWGTHGDHGIIVLSPSSVQDCFDITIEAFNLAERYRTPVIILADAIIGHLKEKAVFRELEACEIVNRKKPEGSIKDYKPFDFGEDDVAPLANYGSEYILRISGSTHDEKGFPNSSPANADKFIRHYTDKIEKNKKNIIITRKYNLEDAEYIIIAFGASARSALEAVEIARNKGMKVGLLQLITIWPFAKEEVLEICCRAKAVIVPEMNLGQIIGEVKKENRFGIPIVGVNKVNSEMITPYEILEKIEEVAKCL